MKLPRYQERESPTKTFDEAMTMIMGYMDKLDRRTERYRITEEELKENIHILKDVDKFLHQQNRRFDIVSNKLDDVQNRYLEYTDLNLEGKPVRKYVILLVSAKFDVRPHMFEYSTWAFATNYTTIKYK